jgi:NAD(P)-dependent dehydrogenase (short-subunit alcohol dehydrogenase family)
METNYSGALRCIMAVLPAMRNRRSGRIVNVSSVAGRFAAAPQAAYAASKWALEAMSECLAQEVKAFNIRVAIVEPGVIATAIFGKDKPLVLNSPYPHTRRLRALFAASLKKPVSPYVVGDLIRQIAETESWQLRYPVGPDAVQFLEMRASFSDEEWVTRGAQSDQEWAVRVKREIGLDVKI